MVPYVERSSTVAGSKIVMSASAPTRRRPFCRIAGTRRSSRCAARCHFADRVHQREERLRAHSGRAPDERARGARMARAVLPVRVARNDGEGLVIATATIRSVLV